MASSSFTSNGDLRTSQSPTSGFVAVNSRPSLSVDSANNNNGYSSSTSDRAKAPGLALGNGKSIYTASPATRAELLNCFMNSNTQPPANDYDQSGKVAASSSRPSSTPKQKSKASADVHDYAAILLNSASPVAIPNTPSSLLHFNRPSPADRFDDSGPYKAEMLARMDQLQRGDRVLPPCDRCRRLHMDCNKNLTACLGCTKKHAKCSWKDVTEKELRENPYVPRSEKEEIAEADFGVDVSSTSAMVIDDPTQGVRDEELLGEDGSDDSIPLSPGLPISDQAIPNDDSVSHLGINETIQNVDSENTPTRDIQPLNSHSRKFHEIPETQPTRAAILTGDPTTDISGAQPIHSNTNDEYLATLRSSYQEREKERERERDIPFCLINHKSSSEIVATEIKPSSDRLSPYPSYDTEVEDKKNAALASPERPNGHSISVGISNGEMRERERQPVNGIKT